MAVNLSLTEALQNIQRELTDVTTVNDPTNYSKLIGTMNWLFSSANGRVIDYEMIRTAGSSKYRPVELRYLQKKGTSDLVTSDASASCTKTDTRRELTQTLNATLYVEDKFSIDEEIIREGTLQTLQPRLSREIRDAMRNCREDMDRQLFAAYASNFGSNPATSGNSGAYTTLQLLASDGTVDPDNFDVIKNHQEDNYMTGPIGILGLGLARKYMNRLAVGNIADGGYDVRDIMSQFGMTLFKDHYTTTALGNADRVIASYAGTSNFYHYNLFTGSDFQLETPDSSIRTTMPDPIFPFSWDFILKYDDECTTGNGLQGAWTGRILLYFDLWIVPDTAFGEPYGDLADFNGQVGYLITEAS